MLWLIYGTAGWIGGQLRELLNVAGQKVDMNIDVTPLVTTSKTLSLQVAIYEKSTTQNVKSNGETVFYKVMKKMVPDANGTNLSGLTENVLQSKTLQWILHPSGQRYRSRQPRYGAHRRRLHGLGRHGLDSRHGHQRNLPVGKLDRQQRGLG